MVTPDETGWRVNALRCWLWVFATPETTVYAICDGRGFDDAAAVLGPDFAGVLVRDGWVAYRGFKKAPHQSCLAHLLRRCKDLQAAHPDSPWAGAVQAVLQDGLALRTRSNAGEISEHGLASARGRLAGPARPADRPPRPPLVDAERFAKHLANEFPAVFLFLCDPSIEATNWRAEQAIRPAVVTRKVCGGNRTRRGADTQQVLASVVRTARQRHLRPARADHDDAVRPRTRRARGACVCRRPPDAGRRGNRSSASRPPARPRPALNPRRPAAARARDPWVSPPAAGTPPGSSPLFAASVPAACPHWRRRHRRDPRGLAPPWGTGMRRGSRQTQRPASEPPGPTVAADDALTSCLGDNGTASLPWALSTATCSAQVRRPASRPSCPSFPTPSQPQRPTPRC